MEHLKISIDLGFQTANIFRDAKDMLVCLEKVLDDYADSLDKIKTITIDKSY